MSDIVTIRNTSRHRLGLNPESAEALEQELTRVETELEDLREAVCEAAALASSLESDEARAWLDRPEVRNILESAGSDDGESGVQEDCDAPDDLEEKDDAQLLWCFLLDHLMLVRRKDGMYELEKHLEFLLREGPASRRLLIFAAGANVMYERMLDPEFRWEEAFEHVVTLTGDRGFDTGSLLDDDPLKGYDA